MSMTYQQLGWNPAPWQGSQNAFEGEFFFTDDNGTLHHEEVFVPGTAGVAQHGSSLAAGRDTVFVAAPSLVAGGALAMWQDEPSIQSLFGDIPFELDRPVISAPPMAPLSSLPQGRPRVRVQWDSTAFDGLGLVPSQGIRLQVLVISQVRQRGGFIPVVVGENYYDSGEIVVDLSKVLYFDGNVPTTYKIMILPDRPIVLQGQDDYNVKLSKPFTFTKVLIGDPTGVELGTFDVNWAMAQQQ